MSDALPLIPKELSWLAFNERVLQEAANPHVPEIQRLRYLGIFSNNLDEFFRVRVADVRKLAAFSKSEKKQQYKDLLEEIRQKVDHLHELFTDIYLDTLKDLRQRKIYLVDETQLDEHQQAFTSQYFHQTLFPFLSPFLLDENLQLPTLNDQAIYFAIRLTLTDGTVRYGIVQIPSHRLSRFVEIPQRKARKQHGSHVFIVLDNIIRHCLNDLFMGVFEIDHAGAYTFKLTRDSELELGDGISKSLLDKVVQSLQKRKKADPVRFIYDDTMPDDLLDALKKRLNIGVVDTLMPGGRYHNSKDFMAFPDIGPKYLHNPQWPSVPIDISPAPNLFASIRERDIAAYYPYHSFSLVIAFLKNAAIDPNVRSIDICLYRVAEDSQVVDALINAMRNGKQVTAVVELQARFDEANNILWAEQLTEAGAQVIFGVPGIKVHAKTILVTRMENGNPRYYSHIGTGNFNEKTARVYTDVSLLTHHQGIGKDMRKLFEFLQRNYLRKEYDHLWVSPHSMRPNICALIDHEISQAEQGLAAEIMLKCNNLVDDEIVASLYRASAAGVKIRLIIRGMYTLAPDTDSATDNIHAISIVDRYLEHPRIFIFHNGGDKRYFIASADLMTRNIDHRVEVTCPVYDPQAQKLLMTIFETQWKDNIKARVLDGAMSNRFVHRKKGQKKIRSQHVLHKTLTKLGHQQPN